MKYNRNTILQCARRLMTNIFKVEQGETFDEDSVRYADYRAEYLTEKIVESDVDVDIFDLRTAIVIFDFRDNDAQIEAIIDYCRVQQNRFFNQK